MQLSLKEFYLLDLLSLDLLSEALCPSTERRTYDRKLFVLN